MSSLKKLLDIYRDMAQSEREKGFYFELLIKSFLENDPKYDFKGVWLWPDWAKQNGLMAQDTGIDLVAEENGSGDIWAIQCKFYDQDNKIYKKDIDSFFTASGKKPFAQRLIVFSNDKVSNLAYEAMDGQQIPCSSLALADLEESPIDWSSYHPNQKPDFKAKKILRPHQHEALKATLEGLSHKDRGKLLMACGTGKTFAALKIAETMAGAGQMVLFLVPSLSLLSQTLTEWNAESAIPLQSYAVCSDSTTGHRKMSANDDLADIRPSDLAYPATTNAKKLVQRLAGIKPDKMTVIFSTYQSLAVINEAQAKYGLGEFSLIICDEAHRTTGATLDGEDESSFVKIHDSSFIKAKKRIYMTATPKVFGDAVKSKAKENEAVLCSMDDESLYGETLYCLNFTEAVQKGLLSDYKVLVLAVDEEHVSRRVQKLLTDQDNELILDDATKIVGCWKALSKERLEELPDDREAMRRAVIFCRDIKGSKKIESFFSEVVGEYLQTEEPETREDNQPEKLNCELKHVDGTMRSDTRRKHLDWLKEEHSQNSCRLLTNVRCLSEGVDVPSLDAVMFFNPRKSQVDVVQAVGRVMRKVHGKKRGYVILPIGVPAGVSAEEALSDNEKYRVVWQILQALRSHDDNFDDLINKIDLGVNVSGKMEVIAVTDHISAKKGQKNDNIIGGPDYGEPADKRPSIEAPVQQRLAFDIGEFEKAIYARIVKKCGNRQYWEEWAGDIAKIAQTHISRLNAVLKTEGSPARQAFDAFLAEIRDDLNDSISEDEAIEMLAQHIITKPVFDALFEGYKFTEHNPVSMAMQKVLNILGEQHLEKESESLTKFYASVQRRAQGIDNAQAKQKIVVELYDKFFRNAFPKMTERLGIVYTPVEVVDFIIHSVNEVLKDEFGQSLASEKVHILDPFTGTGTFITRLIQSGLIPPKKLPNKYLKEIHANEIVLLAYYIAAINIESAYHDIVGGAYQPFEGICLTDTFQLYEKEDLISDLMVDNSARRKRQKKLDIRVIIGNPPYSAGQTDANDNNQNVAYKNLDNCIKNTYAKHSTAANKNALYDSYIRAIRWASDRVGDNGVIGFVTNASFIDSNAGDGLRKCLAEEFSSLYIFHLRGNQRTAGELSRKEGGKIFGGGSRAPIAITIFIKNKAATHKGKIYIHDIGDYLKREDKLKIIADFKSFNGIKTKNPDWQTITPDEHHDWVNQRDGSFGKYIPLGDKKDKNTITLFNNYSLGIGTNRDAWCYNFSKTSLANNMQSMIAFYNNEVNRYKETCAGITADQYPKVDDFINADSRQISWSGGLKNSFSRLEILNYDDSCVITSLYRPFTKQAFYYHTRLNERVYQMPQIFPDGQTENMVICVTGRGATKEFCAHITDILPDLEMVSKGQCFPLYLYKKNSPAEKAQPLFDNAAEADAYTRKDGLSDNGLAHFKKAYPGEKINKEDIFYYIYGLLHSTAYKTRFADNLTKELPRIPCVKKAADFWAFSKTGRALAALHLNYESATPYAVNFTQGPDALKQLSETDFKVTKMKFGKKGPAVDKTTVMYNSKISLADIPLKAYEYVVNGKSALEWVMERYAISTHKESGLVNDANLWGLETAHNPRYPLELFQRVITVSLKTLELVENLPKLEI